MSNEKTNKAKGTEAKTEDRSVFYATKKKFANVFVYDTDMIELGYTKAEVEKMTNGKVNEIFREKLSLSKRVSGNSGYKKDLIKSLGLKEDATQADINKAMVDKLAKNK